MQGNFVDITVQKLTPTICFKEVWHYEIVPRANAPLVEMMPCSYNKRKQEKLIYAQMVSQYI